MSTNPAFVTEVKRSTLKWDEPLRQRLLKFREEYQWSYAQISRAMQQFYGKKRDNQGRAQNVGMGESTIYNYTACKWASSQDMLDRFENRLRGWLDHREQGGKSEEIDESVTAAKLIQHGLAEANDSRRFVSVVGPSGMGKTLISKHFANRNTRGGMVIVEAYDGMTPRAFLAAICRSLGEVDTGSKDSLLFRAAGVLAEQPRLLAIDEANFLKPESLNHLVYIWNQAQIGIVILGTEELEQSMRSARLQRIRTRLRVSINLGSLTDEEIRHRLEESFDSDEVTARVVELAKMGSLGSYRKLDDLIEVISGKRESKPGQKLEAYFERYYSSQEGRRKK
jgi:DNA transposition AAA+ family ATPase